MCEFTCTNKYPLNSHIVSTSDIGYGQGKTGPREGGSDRPRPRVHGGHDARQGPRRSHQRRQREDAQSVSTRLVRNSSNQQCQESFKTCFCIGIINHKPLNYLSFRKVKVNTVPQLSVKISTTWMTIRVKCLCESEERTDPEHASNGGWEQWIFRWRTNGLPARTLVVKGTDLKS